MRAIFACVLALSVLGAAFPSDGGIAYDQISTLYLFGSGTPAAPGSFAAARATALGQSVVAGPSDFPPIGGQAVPNFTTIARFTHGLYYRVSYLGALSRVDDPATMRATIARPDRGQVIYLDLTAKTYRVLSGSDAAALLDPAPVPSNVPTPSAATGGSTVVMAFTRTSAPIGGTTIDGVATHGMKTTTIVTATSADSTCPTTSATITSTKYVDPARTEPPEHYDFSALSGILKAMPATRCRITIAPGSLVTPAPTADESRFTLYSRADSEFTLPSLATKIQSTLLVQRGNVRTTGAADSALFEIPASFTPAATPSPETKPVPRASGGSAS